MNDFVASVGNIIHLFENLLHMLDLWFEIWILCAQSVQYLSKENYLF